MTKTAMSGGESEARHKYNQAKKQCILLKALAEVIQEVAIVQENVLLSINPEEAEAVVDIIGTRSHLWISVLNAHLSTIHSSIDELGDDEYSQIFKDARRLFPL